MVWNPREATSSIHPLNFFRGLRFCFIVFVGGAVLALAMFGFVSCGGEQSGECEPVCDGRCCGSDKCGGFCTDTCADTGQVCDQETCECSGDCIPKTCADLGKECGSWPDGCSDLVDCDPCPEPEFCDATGTCQECVPDCTGRCCGSDGCGGDCSDTCADTEQVCDEDTCECSGICVPRTCADLGKQCGTWPDGCRDLVECDPCPGTHTCDENGLCQEICVPDCAGRCCGSDGCGEPCPDTCADTEQVCDPNSCECAGVCIPKTCAELGKECGTWSDGCNDTIDCDSCPGTHTCDENGQCQVICIPDCSGRCCGSDGCGGTCTDTCNDPNGFCDVDTCTCTSVCSYQFAPTTPFRRLDTRGDAKLQGGSVYSFEMAGRDGIPANAQAVAMRFTVVEPEAQGFITAYNAGTSRPEASVLNYTTSKVVGNTFLVKVGSENKISVYTHATTHLIIDVFGYTVGTQAFHPQKPYRLVDTRDGAKPAANSTTCMTVAGVNGVPADAKAVAIVMTAVDPEAGGSMVAFPGGTSVPPTRSVSYGATNMANGTIVPIGADRKICVRTTARSHFVMDVNGFFESNAAYRGVTPYRKLDVVQGANSTHCYQLAGVDGIPADAQAVAFNLTAVAPSDRGFVTVHAKGTQRPVSSNLNFAVGETTTNGVISKIGDNGQVCFYSLRASRLQVDVVGYWPGANSCCDGQTCEYPPFISCSGATELISYNHTGSCKRGTCDYGHSVTACDHICQLDACIEVQTFDYHDRTEWQDPAYPVTSSGYMDLNALRYITLHYIGVNGVNLSDIAEVLRGDQLDYVINRGYSLGYNSAVSPDGDEWEIRGFDYRCAANGSQDVNRPSYAIQLMLPNTWSVPPQSQIDGVRAVVAKIRATAAAAGNNDFLEINGHRDLKATACPGDVIYNLIQDGAFEP